MRLLFIILFSLLTFVDSLHAKLNVVTTTTDLKAITHEIVGDLAGVESIAKGTQDPHFIEAKPSFMVKMSRADLVIAIGLDLEIGWLPSIITGARNPKVLPSEKGYLEVGPLTQPLEVPQGKISRAEGDVHPNGNPHVTLDPLRAALIGEVIATRLGELDTKNANRFVENAKGFRARLEQKTKDWQQRISKTGIQKIITYHKTLTYFFNRFHIENPAILEPKPGIPPTSGHIMEVIQLIKEKKVPLILVENFFDPAVTEKVKHDVPQVRAQTVPVAVDGAAGVDSIDALYESLVRAVEGK